MKRKPYSDYNVKIGAINREAVRHYFATHIGCTGVECAAGTGLSAMAVSRHLAALRMEWREPERETT
jgi:hypothetical protein